MAETGPIPIRAGWTPVTDHPRGLTYARSPRLSARSRVVTTHTAAPSFSPLALPAVTVASGSSRERTGRSAASDAAVTPRRGCSSVSTTTTSSPPPRGTRTGTISSSNTRPSCAATARRWLSAASSSCSAREIEYSARRFSAVSSMPPGIGWSRPPDVTRPRAMRSTNSTRSPRTPPRRPSE